MESTEGAYWKPEPELGQHLFEAIPDILDSQKENGQFGTEPWIPGDQNELLSLSAVWELEDSPYHHMNRYWRQLYVAGTL